MGRQLRGTGRTPPGGPVFFSLSSFSEPGPAPGFSLVKAGFPAAVLTWGSRLRVSVPLWLRSQGQGSGLAPRGSWRRWGSSLMLLLGPGWTWASFWPRQKVVEARTGSSQVKDRRTASASSVFGGQSVSGIFFPVSPSPSCQTPAPRSPASAGLQRHAVAPPRAPAAHRPLRLHG